MPIEENDPRATALPRRFTYPQPPRHEFCLIEAGSRSYEGPARFYAGIVVLSISHRSFEPEHDGPLGLEELAEVEKRVGERLRSIGIETRPRLIFDVLTH